MRRGMRKLAIRAAMALVAVAVLAACQKAGGVAPVNMTAEGVAIKGYDPVAYFLDGMPVKGSEEFQYAWMGARWLFKDAGHRDLFASDPERYAPRYGGYCAYAVSRGTTADIDPEAWSIVDGKLYLNLNGDVQEIWSRDIPGNIRKADANWPALRGKHKGP
jgi:hypothetical protein